MRTVGGGRGVVARGADSLAQRSAHRLRRTAGEWPEERLWRGAAMRCRSLERGSGQGSQGLGAGSAGPEATTRRRIAALPAAQGMGSAPGPRRSPGPARSSWRWGPRLPLLKGIAEERSPQGWIRTLRPGDVQVPAPGLWGAARRRAQGEGGGKGHIWAKPERVTHGGGTRRGGKRGGGAGRALAEAA